MTDRRASHPVSGYPARLLRGQAWIYPHATGALGARWEAFIGVTRKTGIVAALLLIIAAPRLLAEPLDATWNQAAPGAYQACVGKANAAHETGHAAECAHLAETTARNHADCVDALKLPQAYCDAAYPQRDGAAGCALPAKIATVIDAALEQALYRCARENASGSE